MIKIILQFFKDKKYHIVQDDVNTIITAVDLETKMIITHTVSGRTMIAFRTEEDIRYAGLIENLNQLKVVIRLTSNLPIM
jgi:3'-phosphoadenosine 5'-phosphosulfate (PAPS) 3'-phosphatase